MIADNQKNQGITSDDDSLIDFTGQDESVDSSSRKRGGQQGFASMSKEKQRQIASKGGKAAHEQGTAHEWNSQEAREAGRRGGQSRTSKNMEELEEAA